MIPVRPSKIVCVGRNYLAHAKELGNEVPPVPMLFFKPPSALIGPGEPIVLPPTSRQVEYEAEIGVVIGTPAPRRDASEAERAIGGYHLRQRRHLPRPAEDRRPVGPRQGLRHLLSGGTGGPERRSTGATLEVVGRVNGQERQRAPATDMHFSIPFLVSYISGIMTLEPGDLIATGTPAGVGPLARRRRRRGRDPRRRRALQSRSRRSRR